jgi:hypothetical protein
VLRKIALILGLITTFVGVWVLTQGHSQEAACNSYDSEFGHGTVGATCSRAVASSLMGTALAIGGLVIVVLLLFSIAKQTREKGWRGRLPELAQHRDSSVGSVAR